MEYWSVGKEISITPVLQYSSTPAPFHLRILSMVRSLRVEDCVYQLSALSSILSTIKDATWEGTVPGPNPAS
jgi:hypothetical protein